MLRNCLRTLPLCRLCTTQPSLHSSHLCWRHCSGHMHQRRWSLLELLKSRSSVLCNAFVLTKCRAMKSQLWRKVFVTSRQKSKGCLIPLGVMYLAWRLNCKMFHSFWLMPTAKSKATAELCWTLSRPSLCVLRINEIRGYMIDMLDIGAMWLASCIRVGLYLSPACIAIGLNIFVYFCGNWQCSDLLSISCFSHFFHSRSRWPGHGSCCSCQNKKWRA